MSATVWNRLCLIFSSVGIFITTYLTMSEIWNLEVACGGSTGCASVLSSAQARIGPIPVAAIGLLGYLALAGLSIYRTLGPASLRPILTKVGLGIASFGLVASGYFMFVSLDVLNAFCKWCTASAITMFLLFVCHLFLAQSEDTVPRPRRRELPFFIASLVIFLLAFPVRMIDAVQAQQVSDLVDTSALPTTIEGLIPAGAHSMGGNDTAPVTIVEFGDLLCPHCKKSFEKFSKVVQQSNGNVRFVFRHFPLMNLQGHELALMGAMISEVAGEKNHFWDFLSEMYSVDNGPSLTKDDLFRFASVAGVDTNTLDHRLQDENDPIYKAVLRDIHDGGKLNIKSTPTLIIAYQNEKPISGDSNRIEELLSQPPFNKYVKGL